MPDYASLTMPITEALAATTLWFTTAVLMGSPDDALDVVTAVEKVQRHAAELGPHRS
jgi:hypothetical protein